MPLLIVHDTEGRQVLTRDLMTEESHTYHQAWMAGARVTFAGSQYRIHSVARLRPSQHVVLCVSTEEEQKN